MHGRFSQDIKALLKTLADRPLTLANILADTSERGFSLVIGLLVLPFLLPMPPGLTTVFGPGSLILSLQMALGRRSPWLPRRIANARFPPRLALKVLRNLDRMIGVIEKVARPRWPTIAESDLVWRLSGLCIAWLSLLLMSPIPFTNPIPTVGILAFAIALLENDGLLLCISFGLTALITGICGVILYLLWRSPDFLPHLF